ncbi:MAG: acyl-CoA dehydrogenase [Myxococcales bacterium]|nr:acyl-CoA dehydrogenase [Myxococcales bacterium]
MVDAEEARRVAEDSREKFWRGQSFMRDVFLGNFRMDLLERLTLDEPDRPEFWAFYDRLAAFLRDEVDSAEIDATGEYPPQVVAGLAELGAFGLKIPREYGGLGLTHPEYVRVMQLLGGSDGNVAALLSAHQAIGVPQPIKLFGTAEQKKRFLPRCAKGAISAFALTELTAGSDPARLATTAELSADGEHYVLNGQKLWCTNVTLADLIVVMARNPATKRINCLVVEMDWPGVKVEHRSHFMGLRALANGVVSFDNVKIPKDNLIGKDGDGLKIALVTLNTGRLSLPAGTSGSAKRFVEVVRKWSNARVQWGVPIGKHEAIAHKNAYILASAFAMESIAYTVGELADHEDADIRLEAAAAKEWNSVRNWKLADETLQVRGGRGFETERSLLARGEPAIGIERAMRDNRVNLIFEGTSEIMHLFIAREAVDKHLQVAGKLIDAKAGLAQRLRSLPRIVAFYAWWYPTRWLRWSL